MTILGPLGFYAKTKTNVLYTVNVKDIIKEIIHSTIVVFFLRIPIENSGN